MPTVSTRRPKLSRLARLATSLLFFALCAGQPRPTTAPPGVLTFRARPGDVRFHHLRHVRLSNGRCNTCHDRLFPADAKAPLRWKERVHKTAEANQTSCGGCHRPRGPAFASAGNCRRCHDTKPDS